MLLHRLWGFARSLRANSRFLRLAALNSALVCRERDVFIIQRVQLTAGLLGVLTIGWMLVDLLTISWPLSGVLMVARLGTACALLQLARHRLRPEERGAAWALGGLFGTAVLFCLTANTAFWWLRSAESLFATNTYLYMPFLIAAGLSFFPLTVLECVLLALPTLATMAVSALLWSQFMSAISVEATLWRLGVMAAIASISAMSQLDFLARLTERSARDALTGLLNRKSGEELLGAQFALAARTGRPLSVMFVDLDHFKSINDLFGHEAGDDMLRQVAKALKAYGRRQDIAMRWGGEEFVVALPDTDAAGAERVIRSLAEAGVGLRPDGARQTASIGLAERMFDEAADWTALVELADARMYEAKRAGRNRYVGPDRCSVALSSQPAVQLAGNDPISLGRAA